MKSKDPNITERWPASTRQRNAIEMAFCWWVDDCPTLNAGSVALWFFRDITSMDKKPYIFVIFQGGGGVGTPSSPLDLRMVVFWKG